MNENHYKYLEQHLKKFFENVGVSWEGNEGIIVAHGDKCYSYKSRWEEFNIPFPHGVAIYLLSFNKPYSDMVRQTPDGWVDPGYWVQASYSEFKRFLPPADSNALILTNPLKVGDLVLPQIRKDRRVKGTSFEKYPIRVWKLEGRWYTTANWMRDVYSERYYQIPKGLKWVGWANPLSDFPKGIKVFIRELDEKLLQTFAEDLGYCVVRGTVLPVDRGIKITSVYPKSAEGEIIQFKLGD